MTTRNGKRVFAFRLDEHSGVPVYRQLIDQVLAARAAGMLAGGDQRERRARGILGQAETEIAEKFGQAASTHEHNPVALHLRAMNMLYEAIKERGSMVIVPSSAVETMGLGGTLATAAFGRGEAAISGAYRQKRRRV
jgi:hypothetical protein